MSKSLALFLAIASGPLWAGSMGSQPASSGSDDLARAEAALMDGNFEKAARLAEGESGPEAARIVGAAKEAQGDLKGAAAAYAEAAKDADAPGAAALARKAKALSAAVATLSPRPSATAVPTKAPTAAPTSAATATPTPSPTPKPTDAPTAAPTSVATAAPTAAPTVNASLEDQQKKLADEKAALALEKEHLELEKERQALAEEKTKLAEERQSLAKGLLPKPKGEGQGFTVYLGAGIYLPKTVEKLNDVIRADQPGVTGATAQFENPMTMGLGLRWDGFVLEGVHEGGTLDYKSSGKDRHAEFDVMLLSTGYDWALIRRGRFLGPVELALPIRLELVKMDIQDYNQQGNDVKWGPAFGLSLRVWATPRLVIELQGLYHIAVDGVHGGDNGDGGGNGGNCNGCNGGGGSSCPTCPNNGSNQSQSVGANQDGPEGRLNIGWRFF